MYSSLIHAELAAGRQRDLIAAAEHDSLTRRVRPFRRARREQPARTADRIWLPTATRPAQS